MMKKNERVVKCTEVALVLQRAVGALLVYALGAKSAVFLTATARPALTSHVMQKLSSLNPTP
ncbi:hypothetical protein BVC80_1781g40 [Macleaya cordata]|uniref:Uncharacterized protein n=1 Tax=Macleaya cordata TaxID=56857 RepID=A0A200QTX9_MACCD|nr:hypothetical protein BVC80_1781g40 [Macleaya cordata]